MPVPDYDRLLDAPTRAFIAATNRFYPADTASFSIAEQRAVYDRMCAAFVSPRPEGLRVREVEIAGLRCRLYQPDPVTSGARVIYAHGGGFVLGGLDSHDGICAEIAEASGREVIAIDYRLSPEHPHPAALNDVLAVIGATPGPLVLVGDSAGGNLIAAAAHRLREARLWGQVLIYPSLGRDKGSGSRLEHAFAPMLSRADSAYYAGVRHAGTPPAPGDATALPLEDSDFSRLPMTFASAAECDPLADDAQAYALRLRAAGGCASAVTERGLVHGWLRARHSVPRATAAFTRLTDAISAFARNEWPYTGAEDEPTPQPEP